MLFTPYILNVNNVDNDDKCFTEPAIEKYVFLKIGAAYIQVKNVVYTCREVHILFLPKMNSCRYASRLCLFSGKPIFSGEFLSISETKTHILKNFSSVNACL